METWKNEKIVAESSKQEAVVWRKGLDRNIGGDDEVMTQSAVSNLDSKLSETTRLITCAHSGHLQFCFRDFQEMDFFFSQSLNESPYFWELRI